MAEEDFAKFTTKVANMPHIAIKVIGHLSIDDVASCLQACTAFRTFIIGALEDNRDLREKLDLAVTAKAAATASMWTSSSKISLPVPDVDLPKGKYDVTLFKADVFGLDSEIWMSSSFFNADGERERVNLELFDLKGNKIKSLSLESMPKMQVLAGGMVLVDDGSKVQVIRSVNGLAHNIIVHQQHRSEKIEEPFTRTCVYDIFGQSEADKRKYLKMFSKQDGLPNPNGPIALNGDEWNLFFKKGDKILIGKKRDESLNMNPNRQMDKICMLSFETGTKLWQIEKLWPDKARYDGCKTLLTETFCAFLQIEKLGGPDIVVALSRDIKCRYRVMLRMLDAQTGQDVFVGDCWQFDADALSMCHIREGYYPTKIVASETMFCVANILGSCDLCHVVDNDIDVDYLDVPDDRPVLSFRNGRDVRHMRIEREWDVLFAIVKYNPEDGTCSMRKLNTGLEQILLARCREAYFDLQADSEKMRKMDEDDYIDVRDLVLHGMTEGGIVLGHAKFDYRCYGRTRLMERSVAFVLDLNTAFKLYEPAASFASISFPLAEDILAKQPETSGYCPHYKSFKNGAALSGLIYYEGYANPKYVTIHSFERALIGVNQS